MFSKIIASKRLNVSSFSREKTREKGNARQILTIEKLTLIVISRTAIRPGQYRGEGM